MSPGEELLEILNSNIEILRRTPYGGNKSEFSNYQMFQTVLSLQRFRF